MQQRLMIKRLLWKEWQENLWKLVFGLGAGLAFTVMLFRIRLFPDTWNCLFISMGQLFVVPVVYALDLFSGEMSNRTIHLLFKVPVPRQQIFFSKILVALGSMALIFACTGLAMELMGHGREVDIGILFRWNGLFGVCAGLLLIWFSVFGCQSRSEAGSLAILFGVIIGWAVVWLWSGLCEVSWALHFVPFVLPVWEIKPVAEQLRVNQFLASQAIAIILALTIACYRYVKIRRVL